MKSIEVLKTYLFIHRSFRNMLSFLLLSSSPFLSPLVFAFFLFDFKSGRLRTVSLLTFFYFDDNAMETWPFNRSVSEKGLFYFIFPERGVLQYSGISRMAIVAASLFYGSTAPRKGVI
jgi:hypothetical protein